MSLELALSAAGFEPAESFQLAAIGDGPIHCATFTEPEQASAWAEAENATRNVYLCPNPVRPDLGAAKATAADVTLPRVLLIDVDPEKTPDDPHGLEPEKIARAQEVAREAQGLLHACGAIVHSGRGTQVWVHVDPLLPRKGLIAYTRKHVAREGVKIDSTFNPCNLARLPGFVNHRTGKLAEILVPWSGRVLAPADLPTLEEEVEELLAPTRADFNKPTAEDLGKLQDHARAIWSEKNILDRSKHDAVFLFACLKQGLDDQASCRLLYALPGGKAHQDRRGESYWQSTLAWAKRQLALEERHRATINTLKAAVETDPLAAFERKPLEAIAWLKETAPLEYAKLRVYLKKFRVPLGELEKELKRTRTDAFPVSDANLRTTVLGEDTKWWVLSNGTGWVPRSESSVKTWLTGKGIEAAPVLSTLIDHPWEIVNEPFQAPELPNRQWNRTRARLLTAPKKGLHATWTQMLTVVGRSLDETCQENEWCQRTGVSTGADYLRLWLAWLFQRPARPLPYLNLHGPEDRGKSMLHEAVSAFLTGGCVRADQALHSEAGFNGELAGAILCVVEEVNLSKAGTRSYNRMKDWVTGQVIKIHPKGGTPYDAPNRTHWMQCSNRADYCLILPGDTRITSIYVEGAQSHERMSKHEMLRRMALEAPAFLYTLLNEPLHETETRLGIPALLNMDKLLQAEANRSELDAWLTRNPEWVLKDDEALIRAVHLELPERWWTASRILSELPREEAWARRVLLALRKRGAWEGHAAEVGGWFGVSSVEAGRALALLGRVESSGVKGWTRHGVSRYSFNG